MPGRNGQQYLRPCLQSHRPLDIVAIYLGLNDLKAQYDATADDIAAGLQVLLEIVAQSGAGIGGEAPRVLVMAPPRLGPLSAYADQFDGTKAYANSARLSAALEAAARRTGCHFLDTATLVTTSTVDGIHLDERAHRTIGLAVSDCIHTMGARPLAGDPDDVTPAS